MPVDNLDLRATQLLEDIYLSAGRIMDRVQIETLESFSGNAGMDVQDIVARRLTIIGEASASLLKKYPDFCRQHPEIPLQEARGMRNLLVHDYNRIDWHIVWDTIQRQLPQLIDAIEPFLSNEL